MTNILSHITVLELATGVAGPSAAQTLPQTKPFLSSCAFTFAGSIWNGSSMAISTLSNHHCLNLGKSRVLRVVNGDVNRKLLMPNLICRVIFGKTNPTHLPVKGFSREAV